MSNKSNLILEDGQLLIDRQSASSKTMVMYVGDGVTALSSLSPVGVLPDAISRMIFMHDNAHGLQIPIVISDENGNVVYPGVPISGGGLATERVGEIKSFMVDTAPAGWLECDGSQLLQKDYPDLYACLDGLSSRSDYIIDSANFVIPDLRDQFLRGKSATRAVATRQLDALQNIAGSFGLAYSYWYSDNTYGQGPFYGSALGTQQYTGTSAVTPNRNVARVNFNAARVVRTDVETRPLNIATLFCIKY